MLCVSRLLLHIAQVYACTVPLYVHLCSSFDVGVSLERHVASCVLCDAFVGDSLKQKLDNLSDTVTDNVRGTGTGTCSVCERCLLPRVGPGHPSFPLVHLLPHLFPLLLFSFLLFALPIFFFCPSLPFLPE